MMTRYLNSSRRPFLDDSVGILIRGYGAGARIWGRTREGARAARMRLLGDDALFVRGPEGVALFYDPHAIVRHRAMPTIIQETLFGHGSVHSLDGIRHLHRKTTFAEIAYDDSQVARLTPYLESEWLVEIAAWMDGGRRTAYDAAVGAFGRAVMRWAGVPGTAAAQTRWSARMAQIVDGFGAPYSPAFVAAQLNRWWSDRHATRLIDAVRSGSLAAPAGTALAEWASHRDENEDLLPSRLAGVELQNSMRPMIAVARFVAFAAERLHEHPSWRTRIAEETVQRGTLSGGPSAVMFAQEIRRTSPFVPMLPGRAVTDVELDGEKLRAGGRVVLDILGTNTDERSWEAPERFDPQRFAGVEDYESLTAFIPHGGAAVRTGHRCPGEKLAIAGLATAVAALSDPRLHIAGTGLGVNRRRLPTKPASGGRVRAAVTKGKCPLH